jgi:hypothetical protein
MESVYAVGCHWIGRRCPVNWPPRSPDLTPLDLFSPLFWLLLKAMAYQVKTQNKDHLKKRTRDSSARITQRMLQRVRRGWERRIRISCQCNGAHIEHVL